MSISYTTKQPPNPPSQAAMNPGYPKQGRPSAAGPVPLDSDLSKISDDAVDSSGCYVVFTSLEARRNVTGTTMSGWYPLIIQHSF